MKPFLPLALAASLAACAPAPPAPPPLGLAPAPSHAAPQEYAARLAEGERLCRASSEFAREVARERDRGVSRWRLVERVMLGDPANRTLLIGTIHNVYDARTLSPGIIEDASYRGCMNHYTTDKPS